MFSALNHEFTDVELNAWKELIGGRNASGDGRTESSFSSVFHIPTNVSCILPCEVLDEG